MGVHQQLPPAGPPSASVTTPPNGASYTLGQVVDASYACAPGVNGGVLQSCEGPVATGQAIDTATAGKHTFTVTATDTDGQTATATSTYTVTGPPVLLGRSAVGFGHDPAQRRVLHPRAGGRRQLRLCAGC